MCVCVCVCVCLCVYVCVCVTIENYLVTKAYTLVPGYTIYACTPI